MDLSAPYIVLPRVRVPSTPSTLFSIYIVQIEYLAFELQYDWNVKRTKMNKKRPRLALFKKPICSLSSCHRIQTLLGAESASSCYNTHLPNSLFLTLKTHSLSLSLSFISPSNTLLQSFSISGTRWLDYLLNIWPLATKKICPIESTIHPRILHHKNGQRFYFFVKVANFTKSGLVNYPD